RDSIINAAASQARASLLSAFSKCAIAAAGSCASIAAFPNWNCEPSVTGCASAELTVKQSRTQRMLARPDISGLMEKVEVLQGAAGVEQDDGVVLLDLAVGDQLPHRTQGRSAFGRRRDSFVPAHHLHVLDHLPVADGDGGAAAFANRAQDEKVRDR